MRVELQPAFVLHSRPYRNTSLLVEAFTRDHGRLGLIAKGARQPKSRMYGLLQPFQTLLLSWSGSGELVTLTHAEHDTPRHPLSGRAVMSGFYLNELLVRLLARHDPHQNLFAVYESTLRRLGAGGSQETAQEAALRIFEKRLLQEIGYGLVLDHEAISGRTVEADALYVYEVESGPVMQDHGNGGGKVLRGSSLLALARERLDDRAALKDAKHLMRTVLAHHLGGRPLHSRKLFASTGGGAGEGFKR